MYMQDLVLDPYYAKFLYDFMGQIKKKNRVDAMSAGDLFKELSIVDFWR